MTRIGSSCALSPAMALGKVIETRILTDYSDRWRETSQYAINNKQFLIVTPCVNDGMNRAAIPTDNQWKTIISDMCKYLISIGAHEGNCKISIINEPTKWFRNDGGVARYSHFINMAYDIIKPYHIKVGAGNMEFYDAAVLGDWYRYICANAQFDYLDIHIQGSCDTEERIRKYTDYAYNLSIMYNKKLDCTEAFYGNIKSQYGLLLTQYNHAARIGCENFCNVFNYLDTARFPILINPDVRDKWYKLCFIINGTVQTTNWYNWANRMYASGPTPNVQEEDGMRLDRIYKLGSRGIGVRFIQKVLNADVNPPDPLLITDGIWGVKTAEIVKQYQEKNLLVVDGIVGPQTMKSMIANNPSIWDEIEYEWSIGVR